MDALNGSPLNLDILLKIITFFSERSDVSRTMRTCKILYSNGIPHHLSYRNELKNASQCASFVAFMAGNERSRRLHFLRSLSINIESTERGGFWESTLPHAILQIIAESHIERLLFTNTYYWQANFPLFPRALHSLQHLQSLELVDGGINAFQQLLRDLRCATLASLRLGFDSLVFKNHYPQPAVLLSSLPLVQYLNKVELGYASFVPIPTRSPTFQNIRSLRIYPVTSPNQLIQAAILFPNLEELDLGSPLFSGASLTTHGSDLPKRWKSLSVLRGSLDSVFVCLQTLPSPIQHVEIFYGTNESLEEVAAVLAHTQPSNLTISLSIDSALVSRPPLTLHMFKTTELTKLSLSLVIENQMWTLHPIIDFVIELGISIHTLKFLALRFSSYDGKQTPLMKELCAHLDGSEVATRTLTGSSSIEVLHIEVDHQFERCWTIRRGNATNAEGNPKECSAEIGREIRRSM